MAPAREEMTRFFEKAEYQAISEPFGLGNITAIEQFSGGLAAPKVMVETEKGKFIIAKYTLGSGDSFKNKPREALAEEIKLLNALVDLPVPHYVPDKSGEFILDYKGYGITVYRFLEGKHQYELNTKQVFELGKFLGSFHKQGMPLKNQFSKRYKFYDFDKERWEAMKPHAYDQTNTKLKEVVEEVEREVLRTKPDPDLPSGPIHVDIKADNLLFEGNHLKGVVDFGNFYVGPLILDVGKSIIFNCTREGEIDKTLMNELLSGYESFRPLNDKEKEYLNDAIVYGICSHIWLDLYHVPLKLVPESHTLYFVETFLPAARRLIKET
jgi:homoserine kinase type II